MGLFDKKEKEGCNYIMLSEEEYVATMKAARESFSKVEWKPIRRQYIGMIYAALQVSSRGVSQRQSDDDIDKAIVLADQLIEKIKENEKITGYE